VSIQQDLTKRHTFSAFGAPPVVRTSPKLVHGAEDMNEKTNQPSDVDAAEAKLEKQRVLRRRRPRARQWLARRWLAPMWSSLAAVLCLWFASPAWATEIVIGESASARTLNLEETPDPLLVAINTPYEAFADTGTLVRVVAWEPDGRPAARADVYVNRTRVGRTDRNGAFVYRTQVDATSYRDYADDASTVVVVHERAGRTMAGRVSYSVMYRTESFASDHLYIYTSRGIYAPGDTIELRAIAWRLESDYTPVRDATVEVSLRGPGTFNDLITLETDDWGIAHGVIDVPESAEEGLYTVDINYEGERAETRVRIEHFAPPTITFDHTIPRIFARDRAELAFTVSPGFADSPARFRGTVHASLELQGAVMWSHLEVVGEDGVAEFRVADNALASMISSLSDDRWFTIRVTATSDDGREDELNRDVRYRINPYIAVIELDRDEYTTNDPVTMVVRLTDIERAPMRDTPLRAVLSSGEVLHARTDENGTARVQFIMGDESVHAELFVEDVDAPLARASAGWHVPQPMRSQIDDPVVSEGARVPVRVNFPSHFDPVEEVVHLDVVDTSGVLVSSASLPIRRVDGQPVAEGTFDAPTWGSMLVTFFCVGRDPSATEDSDAMGFTSLGLLSEGQNLIVHPDRTLEVTLTNLPEQLGPREPFRPTVTVRTPSGELVDASLGVSLIDAGTLALRDPLEVTPMDHFYNPELRTLATTGSSILTWPVISRNWGADRFDIALPPFPYKEGGPIERIAGRRDIAALGQESAEPGTGAQFTPHSSLSQSPAYMPADVYYDFEDSELEGEFGLYGVGMGGGGSGMASGTAMGSLSVGSGSISTSGLGTSGSGYGAAPIAGARGEGQAQIAAGDAPPPVIILRNEAPETALWLPDETARRGQAAFDANAPDRVATHVLTVMASDTRGAVGFARASIDVAHPLAVRAELPATLIHGETIPATVAVWSSSATPIDVVVSMEEGALSIDGLPATVRVEPGRVTRHPISVHAARPGEHHWVISAEAGALADRVTDRVHVRPAGLPQVLVQSEVLSRASALRADVMIPEDAIHADVSVSVNFPGVIAIRDDLDAFARRINSDDPVAYTADITTVIAVLRAREPLGAADLALKGVVQSAVAQIGRAMVERGAITVPWHEDAPSAYFTSYVLEVLLDAKDAGYTVEGAWIQAAADAVAQLANGDRFGVAEIAFWGGDSREIQRAMGARVFSILARVDDAHLTQRSREALDTLSASFAAYVGVTGDGETAPDMLTFAYGALGVIHEVRQARMEIDVATLEALADRLDRLRHEGHWEPNWFHAYGGTIETTVAALHVYELLSPGGRDPRVRNAVQALMSTREGWGGWRNPHGTAAALRALSMVGAFGEEIPSTVEVRVGGETVASVAIDPADPTLSARELLFLELPEASAPGSHEVEIHYDGALEPVVQWRTRVWRAADASPAASSELQVSLSEDAVHVGARVSLSVAAAAPEGSPATLRVAYPSFLPVDHDEMATLVAQGAVLGYRTDDGHTLVVDLPPTGGSTSDAGLRLDLPFRGVRSGTSEGFAVQLVAGEVQREASTASVRVAPMTTTRLDSTPP